MLLAAPPSTRRRHRARAATTTARGLLASTLAVLLCTLAWHFGPSATRQDASLATVHTAGRTSHQAHDRGWAQVPDDLLGDVHAFEHDLLRFANQGILFYNGNHPDGPVPRDRCFAVRVKTQLDLALTPQRPKPSQCRGVWGLCEFTSRPYRCEKIFHLVHAGDPGGKPCAAEDGKYAPCPCPPVMPAPPPKPEQERMLAASMAAAAQAAMHQGGTVPLVLRASSLATFRVVPPVRFVVAAEIGEQPAAMRNATMAHTLALESCDLPGMYVHATGSRLELRALPANALRWRDPAAHIVTADERWDGTFDPAGAASASIPASDVDLHHFAGNSSFVVIPERYGPRTISFESAAKVGWWVVHDVSARRIALKRTLYDWSGGVQLGPTQAFIASVRFVLTAECPAGSAGPVGDGLHCAPWRDCGPGTTFESTGNGHLDTICVACPLGKVADAEDHNTHCRAWHDCGAGQEVDRFPSASHDRTCAACAPGRFALDTNQAKCKRHRRCPPGKAVDFEGSATRDVSCRACESGRWRSKPHREKTCRPHRNCSLGTIVAAGGTRKTNRACVSCPSDFFSIVPINAVACKVCRHCTPGKFVSVPCTPTTARVCAACPRGRFTVGKDAPGLSGCVAWSSCARGQKLLASGTDRTDKTCVACSQGTFSSIEDAQACKYWQTCGEGKYVFVEGTETSDRVCRACPAGFKVPLPPLTTHLLSNPSCCVPLDPTPDSVAELRAALAAALAAAAAAEKDDASDES